MSYNFIDYFNRFRNMEPYLFISESEWSYINDNYNNDDVRYSLSKIMMEYPIPYQDISRKDAIKSFKKLKSYHWNDLLKNGKWFSKQDYKYSLMDLYIRKTNVGNRSSNYFHQKNRWAVDSRVGPSPERTWNNLSFMMTLCNGFFSLGHESIDDVAIRHVISMRKYIASQFRPNAAKAIYDYFEPEVVLDFSAGWGDRLAAFYAAESTRKYFGIDPKIDNHPLYREQSDFYSSLIENKTKFFDLPEKWAEFICAPAEDADLSNYHNSVDLVFTSPPYFNFEKYSDEDTQSWIRYKTPDEWLEKFLYATLNNVWKTLRSGGRLMVNIADIYTAYTGSSKDWVKICDPMNDFISTLPGAKYEGCMGLQLAKKPGKNLSDITDEQTDIYGEPIWIWMKE